MKDKLFIVSFVAIILIAIIVTFFWPKTNNIWDDDFTADFTHKTRYQNMDCTCIGFTMPQVNCMSCTQYVDCYGIPMNCEYGCREKFCGVWYDTSCSATSH